MNLYDSEFDDNEDSIQWVRKKVKVCENVITRLEDENVIMDIERTRLIEFLGDILNYLPEEMQIKLVIKYGDRILSELDNPSANVVCALELHKI